MVNTDFIQIQIENKLAKRLNRFLPLQLPSQFDCDSLHQPSAL
jgi:hypothetical protein